MIYQEIKIEPPAHDIQPYNKVRQNAYYALGYHDGSMRKGGEVYSIIRYWWPTYHFRPAGSNNDIFIPGGHFDCIACHYPKYKNNYIHVTTYSDKDSSFYDDTLDEKLGGSVEKLGG